MFLHDMMPNYKKNLLEADCRASQLRVLAQGPPIYVKVSVLAISDRGRTIPCFSLPRVSMWRVSGSRALERKGARRWMWALLFALIVGLLGGRRAREVVERDEGDSVDHGGGAKGTREVAEEA